MKYIPTSVFDLFGQYQEGYAAVAKTCPHPDTSPASVAFKKGVLDRINNEPHAKRVSIAPGRNYALRVDNKTIRGENIDTQWGTATLAGLSKNIAGEA